MDIWEGDMSETKSKVDDRREAARGFAEHLRKVYGRAYEYAVSTGREGFDDLNKSLAQKAIPGFRRKNISLTDELK